MKIEDDQPTDNTFLSLDEALKVVKQSRDEVPFPKTQPKRFTVHASADPSNELMLTSIRDVHSPLRQVIRTTR